MKSAFSLLSRLLLIVCITLYGPIAMAATGSDGSAFSMEICANGTVETVRVSIGETPFEPAENCHDCLTCCQLIGPPQDASRGATLSLTLLDVPAIIASRHSPVFLKPNIRPMPRAPPAREFLMLTTQDSVATDLAVITHEMRSDGRPLFKDATA